MASADEADVAVVGAGLSGLVAARDLTRVGLHVRVIEARNRIGGRIRTVVDDGTLVDLGGTYVGPEQQHIRGLAGEYGLVLQPTWDDGIHLGDFGRGTRRWRESTPGVPFVAKLSALAAIARLNAMACKVSPSTPWAAPLALQWDSVSVAEWLARRRIGVEARGLLTASLRSIFAADATELALLHVLVCIRSAGGFRKYMRSSGAEQARFVDGASALCALLAAELVEPPKFENPVRRIDQDDDGVTLHTDESTFRARRVVVATHPAQTRAMVFDPDLPRGQRNVLDSMQSGVVLKYYLCYSRPFWRSAGYSGKSLSATGLVNATFDHSPDAADHGTIVAFVVGAQAKMLLELPVADRALAIQESLATRFGPEALTPLRIHTHPWIEDEWSEGCFAAYQPPGGWTRGAARPETSFGRVHFAGSETATRYVGAMEGAVAAGHRAAAEVAAALGARPSRRRTTY